jgi:hypothetical protein
MRACQPGDRDDPKVRNFGPNFLRADRRPSGMSPNGGSSKTCSNVSRKWGINLRPLRSPVIPPEVLVTPDCPYFLAASSTNADTWNHCSTRHHVADGEARWLGFRNGDAKLLGLLG